MARARWLPWTLFVAALLPGGARASGFFDLDVVAAMDALEHGDDGRALSLLGHYLDGPYQGEERAEARFLMARAALNTGDGEKACAELTDLERELPEVVDFVLALRARGKRMTGDWSAALAVWQKLLRDMPSSPLAGEAGYGIADAYLALGKTESARVAYEEALRREPRSDHEPLARYNLAVIAEAQRRYVDAAAGYRYLAAYRLGDPAADLAETRLTALVAAGRASPPSVWQDLARIDVLLGARDLDGIDAEIDELAARVKTNSLRASLDYRRAQLAYRRRDFTAAANLFTSLAAQGGRDKSDYLQWLARTYSTEGSYDKAVATYLELAHLAGQRRDGREALFKAAWLSYHGGAFDKATALFAEFVAKYPRDSSADEALWYSSWAAYRQGSLPSAIAALEKLRQSYGRSTLVQRSYYWQGRYSALMGNLSGARENYTQATALEPLSYYGVLATQRLRALENDVRPVMLNGNSIMLASLEESAPRVTPEPAADELPENGGVSLREPGELPWGRSVFDWSSSDGRRAVRLIKLGMRDAAADIIARFPALKDSDANEVLYARARLLYGLGDYATSYRLIDRAFSDAMKQGVSPAMRRYFLLAYPDAHNRTVSAASREFGVSPLLILAIMRQESAFDDRARSWASAHGLMQIIPPTAGRIAAALQVDGFDAALLQDPSVNVRFGAWYLSQLVTKYGGNLAVAIGSYNAGPEAMSSWVERSPGRALDEFVEEIPYKETRHYVKRVLGNLAVYRAIYGDRALTLPDTVPSSFLNNINF